MTAPLPEGLLPLVRLIGRRDRVETLPDGTRRRVAGFQGITPFRNADALFVAIEAGDFPPPATDQGHRLAWRVGDVWLWRRRGCRWKT